MRILPRARKSLLPFVVSLIVFSQSIAFALGQQCIGCQPTPTVAVAVRTHLPIQALLYQEPVPPAPRTPVHIQEAVYRAPTRLPVTDSASVARKRPDNPNVALGQKLAAACGWTGSEWDALYQLWNHESGWQTNDYGPWVHGARACGIPQRYPCNGLDTLSAQGQIEWGLRYIAERYSRPSVAWGGWYGRGRSY